MSKLVRDRIPDIIRAEGKIPSVTYIKGAEYGESIEDKLYEEVEELLESDANRIEEAADVLEVSLALIMHMNKIDRTEALKQVLSALGDKYERRGGFSEGAIIHI
jgi:predicted house-cleaning noncanonical NTP pyrophosphatase (MazG superfamily)